MVAQPKIETRQGDKTEQDWLDYDYTGGYVELIEGELIVAGGASPKHQRMVKAYSRFIDNIIPNGESFLAPLGVKLDDKNIPEPDIMWFSEQNAPKVEPGRLVGIPDLVIEILSPGNRKDDLDVKFKVYERVGVSEYWIADTKDNTTMVYARKEGKFSLLGKFAPDASFDSPVLGKSVDFKRVYADLPPSPFE